MKNQITHPILSKAGFTLVEVLIAVSLFTLIMGGTISTYLMCQRVWKSTSLKIQTAQAANLALARIVYGIETNEGLRSATSVIVDTAYAGVYHYWHAPTNYPPPPGAHNHYIANYAGDGSWRMTISNYNGQISMIDYNINASNLVYWPPGSVTAGRKLIANYVTSATAVSTNNGVLITLSIIRGDGNFVSSNQMSTFVKTRN